MDDKEGPRVIVGESENEVPECCHTCGYCEYKNPKNFEGFCKKLNKDLKDIQEKGKCPPSVCPFRNNNV